MAEALAPMVSGLDPKPDEVVLISYPDNETFVVKRKRIEQNSAMVANVLEDLPNAREVPILNVNGTILAKVLEYINKHGETEIIDGEDKQKHTEAVLKAWDLEYVKVDLGTLFEIMMAANYVCSEDLLKLTQQTVADMIKGKTVEQIYEVFGMTVRLHSDMIVP